mmetsp:Transcript_805/g.1179  ORF Transcript_805/g.1179 Transcript_805/m.1179 type:complete len:102 (+) Transcript_805:493-798(+)
MPPVSDEGTLWKAAPMRHEIRVITVNAAILPTNETNLLVFAASRAAMKNVLSPSSETKTKENAWTKPFVSAAAGAEANCVIDAAAGKEWVITVTTAKIKGA